MRRTGLLLAGCVFVGLAACAAEDQTREPEPAENTQDAGPVRAADARAMAADAGIPVPDLGPAQPESDFPLSLGTGANAYVDHRHGDIAELRRGCQGAQHVWVSLKSTALPPGEHPLRLALHRVSDGAEVVPVHTLRLPWDPLSDEVALIGVTLVIFDPLPIVDQLGDITAEVDAPDGRVGRAKLRVRVEWGPDDC